MSAEAPPLFKAGDKCPCKNCSGVFHHDHGDPEAVCPSCGYAPEDAYDGRIADCPSCGSFAHVINQGNIICSGCKLELTADNEEAALQLWNALPRVMPEVHAAHAIIVDHWRRRNELTPEEWRSLAPMFLGYAVGTASALFEERRLHASLKTARAGRGSGGPLSWRCFHCDEVFTDQHRARLHFGTEEGCVPACHIKASEGGLLKALRDAEDAARDAWAAIHSEGTDIMAAWRGAQARHHQAVTSAEERGYERGLQDMREEVEALRRILHAYGDRVRMATSVRPEWQQWIDEAMSWVAENPEASDAQA